MVKVSMGDKKVCEMRLICRSKGRQEKEEAMFLRSRKGYETGLIAIDKKLRKLTNTTKFENAMKELGALGNKNSVSSHNKVKVIKDSVGGEPVAKGLSWEYAPTPQSKMSEPGVYSIRTNLLLMKPREIWETYTRQTEVESVFRSLKSELGLRPIWHYKENRIITHLFIYTLAYQCVNWIRRQLAKSGITDSWETIVNSLSSVTLNTNIYKTAKRTFIRQVSSPISSQNKNYLESLGIID